jgi:predicted dehydrogenase
MEWQLRRWLFMTWLSGDFIVEMHVHDLDVVNWALGGPPVQCFALGGRQQRTEPEYGDSYDHFAVEYEYANGVSVSYKGTQQDGISNPHYQHNRRDQGPARLDFGRAVFTGAHTARLAGTSSILPDPHATRSPPFARQASERGQSDCR